MPLRAHLSGGASRVACAAVGLRFPAAQAAQTQATSRRSAGTRSITSAGTGVVKHQQLPSPRATPHALSPPQSGQRVLSTVSLIRRVVVKVGTEPSLDLRDAHALAFVVIQDLIAFDFAKAEVTRFGMGEV